MIIEIHPNMTRDNAFDVTVEVYNQLKKLDVTILMPSEMKEYFGELDVSFLVIGATIVVRLLRFPVLF